MFKEHFTSQKGKTTTIYMISLIDFYFFQNLFCYKHHWTALHITNTFYLSIQLMDC